MIKKIIKKILPKKFIDLITYFVQSVHISKNFFYDFLRFKKHSATLYVKNAGQLEGKIIAHYHVIEKGLSYENVRLGFGKGVVIELIKLLHEYNEKKYDASNKQYNIAVSVVSKYIEIHDNAHYDISKIKDDFEKIESPVMCNGGGSLQLKKDDIIQKSKSDFRELAFSRYSIRDFTEKKVDTDLLEEAVRIAMKSPSVCNRQTSRVYIVSDKDRIKKHLSYQNGNRGFGHKINKLLIVTSDLHYFNGSFERNQNFVDAGIFTMSLLYAIHYLGLGAITLNWCADYDKDKKYRQFSKINESENIILMIGVGHIPDKIKVPISYRKQVEDIIRYI